MSAIRVSGAERTNNAQLMADCAELGYLGKPDDVVLDLTYGLGTFWKQHRPANLVTNDIATEADYSIDWTDLRACHKFDSLAIRPAVIVFDGPYKLNGTASTPDIRYGVHLPATADERIEALRRGVYTATQLRPTWLLVKVQNQVNSGRKWWQTLHVADWLRDDWRLVDELHVNGYRAQPAGRRQVHARQDFSTLMVWTPR